MLEKGDVVIARGRLKKVVDFLADADKETIRILASFFEGDAKGVADAKRLKKPVLINKFHDSGATIEVALSKNFVWEEKLEYWDKVTEDPDDTAVLPAGRVPPQLTGSVEED